MPLVYDDEPGSWGRLPKGWPEVKLRTKDEHTEAWRFCVRGQNGRGGVPYGSYVDMSGYRNCQVVAPFLIRVETEEYKRKVLAHMREWKSKRTKRPRIANGNHLRRARRV